MARGLQINRKDKDMIHDTGGISKKRKDPKDKPPRNDCRDRYRTKTKKPENYDKDVDMDKDLKISKEILKIAKDILEA